MVLLSPCLNLKEDATGITIIEDTTKSPTTLIEAAIVALNKIENKILKNPLLNLEIVEKSSSRIIRANFL